MILKVIQANDRLAASRQVKFNNFGRHLRSGSGLAAGTDRAARPSRPEGPDRASANPGDYEAAISRFSWNQARDELAGFADGGLNIAHETLDRQVQAGRGGRPRTWPCFISAAGRQGGPKGAVHVHEAVVAHQVTGRMALDLRPRDIYWCTADPGWATGTSHGIIGVIEPAANA